MQPTIHAHNLEKSFGSRKIIDQLTISVFPGSVYGLAGLNGAGKTTLLRLLLGILKPDAGDITVAGAVPWNHQSSMYRSCGVVLEHDGFWSNLTVAENLSIYAQAKGLTKEQIDRYLDTYWSDQDAVNGKVHIRKLSRGQRMQCALCRALMGDPAALFLDEPVIALDLHAHQHFKKMITAAKNRGAAVIISSHQLDTLDDVCDRVGILRDGKTLDLPPKDSGMSSNWLIDTDASETAHAILSSHHSGKITYDKGYHISVSDAGVTIPIIVKELALAACPVREVRKKESAFRQAIERFFTNTEERIQR